MILLKITEQGWDILKNLILCFGLILILFSGDRVTAQSVDLVPAELESSPILITGYQINTSSFSWLQIYNTSNQMINLDDWYLEWSLQDDQNRASPVKIALQDWLPSEQYAIIGAKDAVEGADIEFTLSDYSDPLTLSGLKLVPPSSKYAVYTPKNAALETGRYAMSPTSAGNFTESRPFTKAELDAPLYGGGLYAPPKTSDLQIVEILASPRNCSPQDANRDLTCYDYIKLHNPATKTIVLDFYKLRIGWGNDNPSISNNFALSGTLGPGDYYTVAERDDGEPLSITAGGGYVWIEDQYNLTKYHPTAYQYPDLGGENYRGFSWALHGSGKWQWGVPSPNSGNVFSSQPEATTDNKATSSNLKPCGPDQERNPATNRCRNIASTASSLTPCKAGQERNPDTNRCRNISSESSNLKPCATGQERNPETNRCRKVAGASTELPQIQDIQTASDGRNYRWWVVGTIAGGAATFAVWEWRRDIAGWISRFKKPDNHGSPPA